MYFSFQGCEHINRAITLEASRLKQYHLEPVSVVPVRTAGGSMSAYAYTQITNPLSWKRYRLMPASILVKRLIGMHLKQLQYLFVHLYNI